MSDEDLKSVSLKRVLEDDVDADKADLVAHMADIVQHITAGERTAWNAKSDLTYADTIKIRMYMGV